MLSVQNAYSDFPNFCLYSFVTYSRHFQRHVLFTNND